MSPHRLPDMRQRRILETMDSEGGPMTANEVAEATGFPLNGVSNTLGGIFLIRRYAKYISGVGPDSKYELLPAGERLVPKMSPASRKVIRHKMP